MSIFRRSRFGRMLNGEQASGIVAPLLAYTTQTKFSDFVTNAVNGEIGIFYEANGDAVNEALIPGAKVFIAQKRDKGVYSLPSFTPSPIGINITHSDSYVSNTGQVFKTIARIGQAQTARLVVGPEACCSLTQGCLPKYLNYGILVTDTTSANQPMVQFRYETQSGAGDTMATIMARLNAMINNPNDPRHRNADPLVTSTLLVTPGAAPTDPSTYTFNFAHVDPEASFIISPIGELVCSCVVVTYPNKLKLPSGSGVNAQDLEIELLSHAGVRNFSGHQYDQGAFDGTTKYANPAYKYTWYQINAFGRERTIGGPRANNEFYTHLYLLVPDATMGATATALIAKLDTIFDIDATETYNDGNLPGVTADTGATGGTVSA